MKRFLIASVLLAAGMAQAGSIKNGNAVVKAVEADKFQIDGTPMGKNMLLGYLQDLKDSKHITGVVLSNPDKASADQRHVIKVIADFLQIKAYAGDALEPIAD